MNENQKKLVVKWSIGYVVVIIMFIALYIFKDPMPIILAIMIIVTLLVGKKYRYDRERAEREMQEFIEYSKQHKAILTAIAAYAIALPIVLFVLSRGNYIIIGTDPRSYIKYGLLAALPVFLFDLSHKVHIYNNNESLTEHSNQPDTD